MTVVEALIARLAEQIDGALGHVASPSRPYALVDFPDHQNVGDNAIWLGETAWLARHGFPPPAYVCTAADYSAQALRAALPEGPIFLHGGGNFGDLWPLHQRLREQICIEFPERRIIQFPQTVWFDEPSALERARSIVGGHADFHLLVRDRTSLDTARAFGCHVALCPDMAFELGPQMASVDPAHPLLAVMRRDKEASRAPREMQALLASAVIQDWPTTDPIRPAGPPVEVFDAFQAAARQRLARGLELLSRGERIVTDRLHVHILCLLLGRPHQVIDNSYGKLSSFISCWTAGAPGLAFEAPSQSPPTMA